MKIHEVRPSPALAEKLDVGLGVDDTAQSQWPQPAGADPYGWDDDSKNSSPAGDVSDLMKTLRRLLDEYGSQLSPETFAELSAIADGADGAEMESHRRRKCRAIVEGTNLEPSLPAKPDDFFSRRYLNRYKKGKTNVHLR